MTQQTKQSSDADKTAKENAEECKQIMEKCDTVIAKIKTKRSKK